MNAQAASPAAVSQTGPYFCEMPSDPCAIIMFGASGDLARRKLMPALYDLAFHSCLAPSFRLLGFARTKMSDDDFRKSAGEFLPKGQEEGADDAKKSEFLKNLQYFTGDYDDAAAFQNLAKRLEELDKEGGLGGNRLFYLATPPEVYTHVIQQLKQANLTKSKGDKSWTRIIIEKPFGRDLASAKALNAKVLEAFDESQIYRIDHYLGNETAGAMRDMIQSQVLQLTSLVAMEAPARFDATSVRNEKIKVLQSMRPFTAESVWKDVVRGQYGPGQINGKAVPGYRQEPGVKPDSSTDTFAALKLHVDNWRWSGVPFYLRSGKRLAQPHTEVAILFKRAPHMVFPGENTETNSLVLNIQPEEGISLSFGAKTPGSQMLIRPVEMDFQYKNTFGASTRPAYATLIKA